MDSTETLEACTLTEELSIYTRYICVYTGRHVVQTQRNGDPSFVRFDTIPACDKPTDGRSSFVLLAYIIAIPALSVVYGIGGY